MPSYIEKLHIAKNFDLATTRQVIKTTCPQDWFLLRKPRLKKLCTECFNSTCFECWNNDYKGEEYR